MDIWHIPGQIIYEFLSLIAIPLTTNSRSPYYLPSCKKHRIIYKFYFSHPTLRMLCKKQIPRISNKHPTINDIDKEYNWLNEEYIYIYLNPFSSSLITNISRPSKLLISRPDNVHTLWNTSFKHNSLSPLLSPYHERRERRRTWHESTIRKKKS